MDQSDSLRISFPNLGLETSRRRGGQEQVLAPGLQSSGAWALHSSSVPWAGMGVGGLGEAGHPPFLGSAEQICKAVERSARVLASPAHRDNRAVVRFVSRKVLPVSSLAILTPWGSNGSCCPCWGEVLLPWGSWCLWKDCAGGREGKLDSCSGGREGPPLGTQPLLALEGALLPAGAGLWARTGRLQARLPSQWPRAGKMRGPFGRAWPVSSLNFINSTNIC